MTNPFVALPDGEALAPPKKKKKLGATVGGAAKKASSAVNKYNAPSPPPPPPPRPPSPPPSRPTSSGPVRSISTPSPKPQPKPQPKPPSIEDFLAGDTAYQQSIRGGQRTLADFLSDLARQKGEAGVSFGQTQEALETDKERRLRQIKDEFASRGILHSGLFAREQGEFQDLFSQQLQQLDQQKQQMMADLVSQETNFRREQELAQERARQQALSRRAARFNIPV